MKNNVIMIAILVIVIIYTIVLYTIGYSSGCGYMQREAVKKNHAIYTHNTNGHPVFTWLSYTNKIGIQ